MLIINGFALVVIGYGSVQAFAVAAKLFFYPNNTVHASVWLRFGRWLVAGLTFQLAADIIETAITPSWEGIGRLAAVAIIRTFLNFFLERDMGELRERGEGSDTA
ncbi:DUF1622 domain-containing protein [Bosea sp. BIWAKO-01]|uniref:DUF1622 domain-containing protein n=1 Tax=Bosea sp. BIWAKO-01 TaxID=506668 RepID=UPI00086A1401|nr:DUF1622 domain-containing protein [Bosea sp. BIWAKO-01]GAU86058.1 hypothetical protein BIWAKO_06006 [Bosea sp. BIWAKO-01]